MIRGANSRDALQISSILELAMSDFTKIMFNTDSYELKLKLLTNLISKKNNRLSYENITVYEQNSKIIGAICCYEGYWSDFYDSAINETLKQKGLQLLEKECNDDEFYIDSVAILEEYRGRGIFKILMSHAFEIATKLNFKKISLITQTPHFYTNLGFVISKEQNFYGEIYKKMIKILD